MYVFVLPTQSLPLVDPPFPGAPYSPRPVMRKRSSTSALVITPRSHTHAMNSVILPLPDPQVFEEARAGIPVTTQRRFDVYPDVSA